jgi:ferritin heavy chain
VNRPGFAKIFFDSASEERDHAIKIIGYLLMRGGLTKDISQLIRDPQPLSESWADGLSALKDALKLEAHVTRKIRDIATTCEEPGRDGQDFNDYHLVDWLTGDFLNEQYEGQRDLAGKISNLGRMLEAHGALGEFLFDKKLLSGVSV